MAGRTGIARELELNGYAVLPAHLGGQELASAGEGLDPLVLAAVDAAIGPGSQFGNTCAIQVHPGQGAQVLHYEQGVYPLPRDRDVMFTTLWALDDFTAPNGATRIVPAATCARPAGQIPARPFPLRCPPGRCCCSPDACTTAPAPTPRTVLGSASSSTTAALAAPLRGPRPWRRPGRGPAAAAAPAGTARLQPGHVIRRLHQRQASPRLAHEQLARP
jgi:hypothetical protein